MVNIMFKGKGKAGVFNRQRQRGIYILFFILALAPAVLFASEKNIAKITVAYSIDCIPFHFQNKDGKPDGIIIDNWKLFSAKTGITLQFIPAVWDESLEMVKSGRADAHAGLFFSQERNISLDFGPSMVTCDTQIFWNKRLPAPLDLGDLKPFRVGVLKGDFAEAWLKAHMPGLNLIAFNDNNEMMSAIKRHQLLVFAAETLTALHYLQEYELRAQFKFKPTSPLYSNDFFPAVKKGNHELLKVITDGMNEITENESRHIARRWATGQKISDSDTLIISMDRSAPPLTMVDSEGNPSGLLVEMWQLWSEKTKTPVTFRPSSWKASVDAVKTGEADIHSGVLKDENLSQWMAFSVPIHRSETALFFKNSDPGFSLEDLANYRVGVLSGSYQADYLAQHYPEIQTVLQGDGEALIFALLKGDVAAVFHETLAVEAELYRLGLSGKLKKGSKQLLNNAIHAGVLKQNTDMLSRINEGFAAIPQNKFAEIESRWIHRKENRFYSTDTKALILNEEEKLFLASHSPLVFSEVNWKPMSIVGDNNQFGGIIADYLTLITQRSGLRFEFRKSDTWVEVLQQYVNKEIDVVPALGKNDTIDRPILLSKPFVRFPFVIVTMDNVINISDVSHLKNLKVAVGKGYTSYYYLRDNYPEIELVQTDDVTSGLISVANRKVSAFVGHMAVVSNCIKENGLTNLKIAGETDYTLDHCIGVDPKYPMAISIINNVLDSLDEQAHQTIYNRWLSVHYEKGIDYALVLKVFAGGALFVGFILYWNRKLSREVSERKLTEQRLIENEQKTRAMSEAIHDALIMIDEKAEVMYWNQAAEKLFGISTSEAMGKDMHSLIAPVEYMGKTHDGLLKFAKSGQGPVVGKIQELTARKNDGTIFPVEVGVSAFKMRENWYAVGTIRDITDRLEAQETVNTIRAELQQIFDNTHVGLIFLNEGNQIHRCNERTSQILGYDSAKQMHGMNVAELHLSEKNYKKFLKKYESTLASGEQVQVEYQLKKKDGTVVWCSLSGKVLNIQDSNDMNKGSIWVMDDITEKRKTRKALRESEERIKTILNAINTGTIIIDPIDRTIVDVNPLASKMIGLPGEQIAGKPYEQFISPKDSHPVMDTQFQSDTAEWELIKKDGTKVPILNTTVPVVLDGKKMILESFVDLTSQKEVEKQLYQNLTELERFYKMAIDREEKMIDLKAEVNALLTQTGQKEKYIVR